ncbi:hypothetical protein EMIHUDRAFT_458315, partial [Emiliania huxleyi CCMP1516]|uniref:Uncharacterized protein n=2 Tax=Emiliania huxleyi TaxID=2903 RepID=A0A0D3JDL6_EMIH1
MDESEDDSDCSVRSDRPTQFRLNGKSWDFENPVTLVLAAARQLGMAIGRDVNLLWIADEALLDEFDEGEADERLGDAVPAAPLSEEVASHYTSLYEARSRTTFVRQAAGAHPPLPTPAGRRGGRASRAERARRRLALREARLSNISERSREDSSGTEAYSESASSPEGGRSDEPWMPSGRAAPAREGTAAGLARALPRIDSASLQLDLLDSEAAKAEPAGGEGASEAEGLAGGRRGRRRAWARRRLPRRLGMLPSRSVLPSRSTLTTRGGSRGLWLAWGEAGEASSIAWRFGRATSTTTWRAPRSGRSAGAAAARPASPRSQTLARTRSAASRCHPPRPRRTWLARSRRRRRQSLAFASPTPEWSGARSSPARRPTMPRRRTSSCANMISGSLAGRRSSWRASPLASRC